MDLNTFLDRFPLIAILRGVMPDEVIAISDAVVNAGFQILEVPLNSPSPFESIELLAKHYPDCLIGGGTVCSISDVRMIRDAGGRLILMPHGDPTVVVEAKRLGMLCVPGGSDADRSVRRPGQWCGCVEALSGRADYACRGQRLARSLTPRQTLASRWEHHHGQYGSLFAGGRQWLRAGFGSVQEG